MYYTGIDLHKKTSFIMTINAKGKIVSRGNIANCEKAILAYFAKLDDWTKIVIESTGSWYWLYDLFAKEGFDVVISNPAKTKAIASAKIKNDKMDSHMLAQLLRADLISTFHVSSLEACKLIEILRHRSRLVRDATLMKNRIHMLLMKNNFQSPFSDLFGVQGVRYLKKIELPDYHRHQFETYLLLYHKLKEKIEPLTKRIHGLAKENHTAQLLMTIPDIGPNTAIFIVAEVDALSRFRSYRNLASYAGLVPSLGASAGKEKRGRITKQGSPCLRTALVEAA